MAFKQLNIGKEEALKKIKHYCGYSERTHKAVRQKLYGFGLYPHEVEELMATLIEENYLNEERYAIAYAGGKFRMNHWGKVKIKQAMQMDNISAYCIKKALAEIDGQAYRKTFEKLAEAKLKAIKGERSIYAKKAKLQSYLLQKGYEPALISQYIKLHIDNK